MKLRQQFSIEQDVLDQHDDDMTNLSMRIEQFEAWLWLVQKGLHYAG